MGWVGAFLAPIVYAWRGRRDMGVALLFLILQAVFGLYTWRISASFEREKREWLLRNP
jgi:heme A synthase